MTCDSGEESDPNKTGDVLQKGLFMHRVDEQWRMRATALRNGVAKYKAMAIGKHN